MRRWSSAALLALLLAAPARAARVYDPEIALLLLNAQKANVSLVREEMVRQAEWMKLGAMQVLLPERIDQFTAKVAAGLGMDSDVVEDYRTAILDLSPGDAPEVDRLIGEIRRYHDLRPGPPLERVPLPPSSGDGPPLLEEDGVGADVEAALKGTSAMDEPVAYAERRFGSTGPFLRRRKWNLDFYFGSFDDLIPHYRKLGYRRVYRLRAPYVSFGKSAYVLAPEPGTRPRLVYCGFYGQDLFLHARSQWAILTDVAQGQGPSVRTLTCPACAYTLPAVKAMRALLSTIPYPADYVIVGYDYLFAEAWKSSLLGVYENDYWHVAYYKQEAGVAVTVAPRHTNFGEIMTAALDPFVRRGARAVFYAGNAAVVDETANKSVLSRPTEFAIFAGPTLAVKNVFARAGDATTFAGLPTPLFATREWLADSRTHGVTAFEGEMSHIAQESQRWKRPDGTPVEIGLGAILGGLSGLHPEEDRTFYTLEYASQMGRESAKKEFFAAVSAALSAAARDRNR